VSLSTLRVSIVSTDQQDPTVQSVCKVQYQSDTLHTSVPDPDPVDPDPHVFGPPGSGSGSTGQRYGSGSGSRSGSGSFYHHAKIVRKTLIPSIL
jgi:hypothetical protein